MLILAAQNTVSDARMEFLIRDRQSWLRFPGFGLGAATPDANTIRLFCERLTRAGAIDTLFSAFDRQLRDRGYLPMGGQIVDATLVAAPKAAEHQSREGGDQGRQDGSRDLARRTRQGSADVWADTAYRSQANETWLKRHGRVSCIHRKKPRGRPMPERTARSKAAKSSVRARVEHVFARQKNEMDLVIRTIGLARATAKVVLANLAYNMNRPILFERRAAMA